jgi:hypothetical protein
MRLDLVTNEIDSSMFLIPKIIANLKLPFLIDPEYQATYAVTAHHFSSTPSIRSALITDNDRHLTFKRCPSPIYDQQPALGTGSTRLAPKCYAIRWQ